MVGRAVVVPQQSNGMIFVLVLLIGDVFGEAEKLEADKQERRADAEDVRKGTEGKGNGREM